MLGTESLDDESHLRRSDHISDALVCLHWLRVPEQVEYKIAVLTYKVLCGMAPPRIWDHSTALLMCLVGVL